MIPTSQQLIDARRALMTMVKAPRDICETMPGYLEKYQALREKVEACGMTPFQIYPHLFFHVTEITLDDLKVVATANILEESRGATAHVKMGDTGASELKIYADNLPRAITMMRRCGYALSPTLGKGNREERHL